MEKKILILGGSSDIGVNLIKKLLKDDWNVSAHYSQNSHDLKKISNKKLSLIKINFKKLNTKNYKAKLKKILNRKYNAYLNLIGFTDKVSFEQTNLQSLNDAFKINTFLPILIQKEIVKNMLKHKRGRILNCTSIGIKFGGGKNSFNYSFSKHALEFIPNSYKLWANKNVLINNLRIGVTNTKIHARMGKKNNLKKRAKLIPIKRIATIDEMTNKFISVFN